MEGRLLTVKLASEQKNNEIMTEIRGPYVDGAFENKSGETVFYCVDCANERNIKDINAIMYHDMPGLNTIPCRGCDGYLRGGD
jgi:hypothetical protein